MKLKALILAEVCNPEWASLPNFSFKLFKGISENVEVVLVTSIRNKASFARNYDGPAEIVFIDTEYIAKPFYWLAKGIEKIRLGSWMTKMALKYLPYIEFERQAWKTLKARINGGEFDIAHRISPVSPTLPSPFSIWAPIPFILGPINGGLKWPHQFASSLRKEREFIIFLREAYKYLPYYKRSMQSSTKILSAFPHIDEDLKEFEAKIVRLDELGINTSEFFPSPSPKTKKSSLVFLFVGRLVPYKNPDVVLEAFIESNILSNHTLKIVGDGPEMASLNKTHTENGASKNIKFLGWRNSDEIAEIMREADVFVFPTIREVGGNVIVEAMASGLPCIVCDYGGPRTLISDERGIKIELKQKLEMKHDLRIAMEKLAADPLLRTSLGLAALNYAQSHYDWKNKGRAVSEIYKETIKGVTNEHSLD